MTLLPAALWGASRCSAFVSPSPTWIIVTLLITDGVCRTPPMTSQRVGGAKSLWRTPGLVFLKCLLYWGVGGWSPCLRQRTRISKQCCAKHISHAALIASRGRHHLRNGRHRLHQIAGRSIFTTDGIFFFYFKGISMNLNASG